MTTPSVDARVGALEMAFFACGTDEFLRGARQPDDTIQLTCERCGASWVRDRRAVCRCAADMTSRQHRR